MPSEHYKRYSPPAAMTREEVERLADQLLKKPEGEALRDLVADWPESCDHDVDSPCLACRMEWVSKSLRAPMPEHWHKLVEDLGKINADLRSQLSAAESQLATLQAVVERVVDGLYERTMRRQLAILELNAALPVETQEPIRKKQVWCDIHGGLRDEGTPCMYCEPK